MDDGFAWTLYNACALFYAALLLAGGLHMLLSGNAWNGAGMVALSVVIAFFVLAGTRPPEDGLDSGS